MPGFSANSINFPSLMSSPHNLNSSKLALIYPTLADGAGCPMYASDNDPQSALILGADSCNDALNVVSSFSIFLIFNLTPEALYFNCTLT